MATASAIGGDDVGWIERQLTEVESLRQIYFEEEEVRVDVAALEALAALAALAQDGSQNSSSSSSGAAAPVSVSVRLRGGGDDGAEASHVRLSAVLPWGYPSSQPGESGSSPVVWLEPDDGAGSLEGAIVADDDLCAELQARALELARLGEECLLPLIQAAEGLVAQRLSALTGASSIAEAEVEDDEALAQAIFDEEMAAAQANATARVEKGAPSRLGRRAMFSHHIIASSKRQAISQWAAQLRLGGVAKIGWPGLIIVEGDEEDVKAYVEALSRLRWKHFVVRGEQILEGRPGQHVDDLRALPAHFQEFGTDAMSEFAACCRAHGLEELFLIALKLPSGGAGATDGAAAGEKRKGGKKR